MIEVQIPGSVFDWLYHGTELKNEIPEVKEALDAATFRNVGRWGSRWTLSFPLSVAPEAVESLEAYAEALDTMSAEERGGDRAEPFWRVAGEIRKAAA